MKKSSVLAITAAIGIAGSTVLPVQSADASATYGQSKGNGRGVYAVQTGSPEELKDILNWLDGNIKEIYWQFCPPFNNTPVLPDTDSDIEAPNTDAPAPEVPNADTPDTEAPDTDVPNTEVPDTGIPAPEVPDSNTPDTDLPNTDVPDTETPDMGAPGTDRPGENNNTPGVDTDRPGVDGDRPEGDANKPGGDTNRPGGDNTPGTDTEARTFAEQVVDLVNGERAKAGLTAITLDKEIEAAALVRAKEIEASFSHTRPDGSSFSTALTERGITYRGSGENIAWGQRSPQEVMNSWMNSDGHRANILNPKFTKMGVGYYQNDSGRDHWTQLFTY